MKKFDAPYFIAETAFHHEGDVDFLIELVEQLITLDIQAIKFHLLFDVEDYMVPTHTAIDVIKKISIPKQYWESIFSIVNDSGKEIVALTNDIQSLKYVNSVQEAFPISSIELHSTGLNDLFLLQEALQFNKLIILGIGGSSFDEVQFAVDFLRSRGKNDILLMHGFQSYPTDYAEINFGRILLMKQAFDLPIGYADHTDPADKMNPIVSTFPISLGVRVLEKHVTHVFGQKRIDAQAAVTLEVMEDVIKIGNALVQTMGTTPMEFSPAELGYGNTGPMKKAMVARNDLKAGQVVNLEDIAYKRTDSSSMLQQKDIFKVIGSKTKKDIFANELLTFDNIEYQFKNASFDQFFVK